MKWYLTLSINQRINLKANSVLITGIHFDLFVRLFGLKEAINLIYDKLIIEGYEIE
jgi:hypothetical protein